jgi:hypothetical protein
MQDRYGLTPSEWVISKAASAELGFPVLVFRDGGWICQPLGEQKMGFGSYAETAIQDCKVANSTN